MPEPHPCPVCYSSDGTHTADCPFAPPTPPAVAALKAIGVTPALQIDSPNRELPGTAAEAFKELFEAVGQLADMAAVIGLQKALDLSSRACFLIGSLEISAEMGGNLGGRVPDQHVKRANAFKNLERLEKQLGDRTGHE